ncbi:ligand-gated channel protein [Paracandidimonas soli]|uniref:ligand-gated channel protein n=1 Tax=Paracandidimonas soli TaxID=1917182 RepID=UPI003341B460
MSNRLQPNRLAVALQLALAGTTVGLLSVAQAQQTGAANTPVTLGNIVVSASGFEQAVEDAPASITVIPHEELAKRAYPDITEALKDVPGVVVTGGGSSSDISIRGMASGYTMLLVDGVRQNSRETRPNSDGSGIEQGWLPPIEAIERIEVIRGPMSSLYGSDAMGGVINIITRKVAKEWGGSVRMEGTLQGHSRSGDIYGGNVYLTGPLVDDLLGIQIYGNLSRRNEDKFVNGFNKQQTESGTVKLSLTPNKDHDITLEAGRTLQERTSNPGKSMAPESCRGTRCTPNEMSQSKYSRNVYALSHNGRWGKATSYSYVQQEQIDNPGRNMFLKNTEANSQWTLPLGSHIVTAGASYKKESLEDMGNQLTSLSKLDRYQWALYVEDEWSMTDSFALTGGVRMNKDENYGTHWTPRLYGVWHATDNFSIKGGVSTGFKAPSLRSAVADWGQITGGGGDPAIIRGNPDLKPEKSISQELSFIWDNRQDLSASLTLFNTDFKDKITEVRTCMDSGSTPPGSAIVDENCSINGVPFKFISDRLNVDKANMRGIEATLTWQPHEEVRLAANYTYTRSEQKSGDFKGQPLNKMPKHMFNTTVDWMPNEATDLWARWNFRGKSSEYLSRTSMAEGTPSFAFLDAGVQYKLNRNLTVGFAVYNIFDKQVNSEDFGAVYDGRRYWASATYRF